MTVLIGYARVSSTEQSLDLQLEALASAGVTKCFAEKQTGTSTAKREELARCLDYVREGDILVVTRLDRLARSLMDLRQILDGLDKKGVGFRCLQQQIDTTTSEGRLMLNILGSFAEFETEIRKERQMEGIAKAKAEGRLKRPNARKPKSDENRAKIIEMRGRGMNAAAIARELKIGRATVYRAVPEGWDGTFGGAQR